MSTSVPPPHTPEPAAGGPPAPRSSPSPRLKLVASIALVAVLAVAAFIVFGGSASKVTGDPVAQAATVSSSAPGYQMHMAMQISSPSIPTPITATGNGAFDVKDRTGSMTLSMNFGNQPQLTQVLGSSTLTMQEILNGTTVFMKLPAAVTRALPTSGKQWIAVDLAKASGIPGLGSLMSNPVSTDPSQMLQYLKAASDSVVAEGQAQVNGFPTTHYHANLSLDRIPGALPPADRGAAQQALSTLQQTLGLHQIPVDVWIDTKHMVRRMQMTINASLPNGKTLSEIFTIDITSYGPQPRPALPPAGEVANLNTLGLGG